MLDPLFLLIYNLAIIAAFFVGRHSRRRLGGTTPPGPRPAAPPRLYPSLGEALAESHRKIWDALRTSPESVAVVPAERIVNAKARKNDRHGAWIKVSVPDEVVLALGKRPEGRKYEVFLVTVPGPAARVSR